MPPVPWPAAVARRARRRGGWRSTTTASAPPKASARGELNSAPRSICVPRCTKNSGMREPLTDSDQLLGDPARLAEQRDDHSDDEPGDEDGGAEPGGQPRAGEQGEQRDTQIEAPSTITREVAHALHPGPVAHEMRQHEQADTDADHQRTAQDHPPHPARRQHERQCQHRRHIGDRDPCHGDQRRPIRSIEILQDRQRHRT